MQIKKTLSLVFGFVAATVMAAAFCLAGCASIFSFNGKFSRDEIVLEIGDKLSPDDYFSSNGAVEFFSEDESVIAKTGRKEFLASKSGKTVIVAKSGDMVIDSVQIYVKYVFQTPTNLTVSNDGLVSWDSSAFLLDGKTLSPRYTILINDDDYEVSTNSYQLSQSGDYTIQVMANATDRVKESAYSNQITFAYDKIAGVSGITFVSTDEFGSQSGTLSWVGSGMTVLDIGGIRQEIEDSQKLLNFSSYPEGSEINAKLYITNDGKESKSSEKTITKLSTADPKIVDYKISWNDVEHSKHTLIRAENVFTNSAQIVTATANSSVLEGLGEGIYKISSQAIGQEGYANGNTKSFDYNVGKISNVEYTYSLNGEKITFTFTTTSEYNRKIVVRQNGNERYLEFSSAKQSGKYVLTSEFTLSKGENVFTVQAIPTLKNGEFVYGGRSTKYAICSDEETIFNAYNVGEIGKITHSTDENENSVLTFNNVEFADRYTVTINDISVSDAVVQIGERQTTINLGKITKEKYKYEKVKTFKISITASRETSEGEIASPSVKDKWLDILPQPTLPNCKGEQNNSSNYSWPDVTNAKYIYQLFATDETFKIQGVEPTVETTSDHCTSELNAGYYFIEVRSIPIDEDKYLASEDWSTDWFYFTERIDSPALRLDYQAGLGSDYSGYVLKIKTVEFGYQYDVLFGDDEENLGSIFNTAGLEIISFKLPSTAILNDSTLIKVVAIAEDSALQKIHQDSTSQLCVQKLAASSNFSIEENDSKIVVANDDDKSILKLYKNGVLIAESQAGEDAVADISTYDGEFTIQAKKFGYDEFDQYTTSGTTKIDSDYSTFTLHRSQTPFNLVYNASIVNFEHNDQAEKYVATITVSSDNGSIQKSFDVTITEDESDSTKKSFNLEEEITALRLSDAEFNAIFAQKTQITLTVCAYISQNIDGIYYLPSFNATSKHNSKEHQIVIAKFDPVDIDYDYDNKVIFWDGDESLNPIYDIYLDGTFKSTIKNKSESGKFEYDISGYSFAKAGEYRFYIVASSNNALASDQSKNIVIRKISQVQKLNVIKKAGGYFAQFAFSAGDEGHIDDVIVNGESNSNAVKNEFLLTGDTFSIVVKGENYVDADGDKVYYISSEESTFTIKELVLNDFEANSTIANKTISWQDYAADNANSWALTLPEKNLKYMIEVWDGDTLKTSIESIATISLSLENDKLTGLVGANYTFKLYAYISDYEIANGGSGYHGKILLEENVAIKKFVSVSELKVDIDDSQGSIAEELEKEITLLWEFSDTGSSDVNFEVYINGELKTTTDQKKVIFSQADFGEDENTVSVVAVSKTDIRSDKTEIKFHKYSQPEISIDDRGVLKITDKDVPAVASGYIIEVTMLGEEGEPQTKEYYTTAREYDLNNANAGINAHSGEMKIRLIQRVCDTSVNAIPTIAAEATKTVLAAPTISQTASGFVISSTDDGVTFFVKCDEKNFDEEIDGNTFTYPDDWEGGTYSLVIYAQRESSIDSWKNKPIEVQLSRVGVASSVTFDMTEDYLDYKLSWEEISDADGFEIEVFADDEKIGDTLTINQAQVLISEIRDAIDEFRAGEYTISLRTLTDYAETEKTNSLPFKFKVSISENNVENAEINEDGKLVFESDKSANMFIVSKETNSDEWFGEIVDETTTEYVITKYSGKLEVSIVQINNSESKQIATAIKGVILNGVPVSTNITKLQDFVTVETLENSGKIVVTVSPEVDKEDERIFRVIHDGVEKDLNVEKDGNKYSFLAIEMVNLFDNLVDGDFKFEIVSLIEGFARSNAHEGKIGYSNHNNYSSAVKQDETHDYIILTGDPIENQQIKAIHVVANDEKYYYLSPVFGYWIEDANVGTENPKYFSSSIVTGANISSTKCCAINISDLLDEFDENLITIKVGFVSIIEELFTVANYSEIYQYKKLSQIDVLEINDGNFRWTNTSEENPSFVLYLDGETTKKEVKVAATTASYGHYLGENISMAEEFTAGIKAVSSTLQVVPSKITYYLVEEEITKVSQLAKVESEMTLSDGVLKLEFNSETTSQVSNQQNSNVSNNEKNYPSIEAMLAVQSDSQIFSNASDFAKQLISNRLTQPFNFRLKDLEKVEFNLKFVETDPTSGTKKIYYTSVKAVNLLSALSEDTLNGISDAFDSQNITSQQDKTANASVYRLLTNIDYFTGVASANLLFREIGVGENGDYNIYPASKIPAGTYDIYIQQIGSADDNTISSQYKLAKQSVGVVNSPMTRVDSEEINDGESNVYYAKFVPLAGKETYKFNLHDNVTGEVVEYTIYKSGDDYVRTTFTGELKTLKYEGGFVWIPMSGEEGVIYDEGVTNIHGYDLVIQESDQIINSYRHPISNGTKYCGKNGKFTIGENEYTYTIENGEAQINEIEINDGEFTIDDIVYSVVPVRLSGHDFTADIYAVGDETNINGKSEAITVTFLKFRIETLKLQNGRFTWQNFDVNSKIYPTVVSTQKINTTATTETSINASFGVVATFSPDSEGAYNWFKFYTKGEAAGYHIHVDSEVYMIENLYKLQAPTMSIVDGVLNIIDKTASLDDRENKTFILSNDVAGNSLLSKDQTYVTDEIQKNSNGKFTLVWQTGLNGLKDSTTDERLHELYNYHVTELTATSYSAAVSGYDYSNDKFNVEAKNIGTSGGYYSVSIEGLDGTILLQSERTTIGASKLAYGEEDSTTDGEIKIVDGNIEWTPSNKSVAGDNVSNSDIRSDGDLEILYEVTVDYYYDTSDELNLYGTRVFYTNSNKLSAEQIVDPVSGEEFKYVIAVRANVYAYSASNSSADLTSLENISYKKVTDGKYATDKFILCAEILTLGSKDNPICRSNGVTNFAIKVGEDEDSGKLAWEYDEYEENVTDFRVYSINGGKKTIFAGKWERKEKQNDITQEKSYEFIFTMDEGQLVEESLYNFEVVAYQKTPSEQTANVADPSGGQVTKEAEIAANPVKLRPSEEVKLLPSVTLEDYTVNSVADENGDDYDAINFDKYFEKHSEKYGNSFEIFSQTTDEPKESHYYSKGSIYKVDESTIEARAIPVSGNIYLRSDTVCKIKLEYANFSEYDDYFIDDEAKTISWTFGANMGYQVGENGAKVYLERGTEADIVKYLFGVYEGQDLSDMEMKLYINFLNSEGEEVEGAFVYLNQVEIVDDNIKAKEGEEVVVYNAVGEESGYLAMDTSYALTAQSVGIKVNNPITDEEEDYYLPLVALTFDNGEIFAAQDCEYYIDIDCESNFVVDEGYAGTTWTEDSEYQLLREDTRYYVKTSDVSKYIMQNEDCDGVTFKVSFTTTYSYKENSFTYNVTENRVYQNVPIGNLTNINEFNGYNVGASGLRITTFEFPVAGNISNIAIHARKSENNLVSKSLKGDETAAKTIAMDLFSLGDGSESNPYIITSEQQFLNMAYRTQKPKYLLKYDRSGKSVRTGKGGQSQSTKIELKTIEEDGKYYFKQDSALSIDVNGFAINEVFNGVYDGNGKSLTVNVASIDSLKESVNATLPTSNGFQSGNKFNKGAGLFKTVGENGTIKNVVLKFSTTIDSNFSAQIGVEKALIGGLVFQNLGNVDAITVQSSSVTVESALRQSGALAIAPVIGENRKNATNLVSTANVEISSSQNSASQHFYYGGLVGFHNAGTILYAKNQNSSGSSSGSISVNFTSNNGTVCVGGIAIVACAKIDVALNTKDISASITGGSAFAGGIVALAVGSTLYSCVNTANISATYAGGIAYAFYKVEVSTLVGLGTVNGAVDNLFAKTMQSLNISGAVYTYSPYAPNGITPSYLTASTTIKCKDKSQYTIEVTLSKTYSADIIKKTN